MLAKRQFGGELCLEKLEGYKIVCLFSLDSQSVIHLAGNHVYHSKTKHIDVKYHFLRQAISEGGIDMKKVHTQKLCRHVYKISVIREVTMVCSFSWFEKKVMNSLGKSIRKFCFRGGDC